MNAPSEERIVKAVQSNRRAIVSIKLRRILMIVNLQTSLNELFATHYYLVLATVADDLFDIAYRQPLKKRRSFQFTNKDNYWKWILCRDALRCWLNGPEPTASATMEVLSRPPLNLNKITNLKNSNG
ncbi:hypothetical protein TNCV_3412401 [Trichonephila clavipes]|uniref:Uncharacterized protein n=1 Tax=Trichonephila clavipes TaxID=2585209 RepID=A0A8X6RJS0_TRICX|nr:hypothetical protein TNCV_3412401 [Trichonephila clavipes]